MYLAALIVRPGLAHHRKLAVEHRREAVDDGLGGRVVHFGKYHKTGGAFDQCADRGVVRGDLDQIAFPMTPVVTRTCAL